MFKFDPKKVKKNGSVYYRAYYDRKAFWAKDKETLFDKIEDYIKHRESPGIDDDTTVNDYIIRWYKKIQDSELTKATIENYGYCVIPIIERIGEYKLKSITPMALEDCVTDFANTPLKNNPMNYPSQAYINRVIRVLKLVFKDAKKELVFPSNYAEDLYVKSKSKGSHGHRALSEEEIIRVLNFDHPFRPFVLFMLLCGLMPEETVPLLWKDIIYNEEREMFFVDINKSADLTDSKVTVREDTTKTIYRKRTIAIPAPLSEWVAENKPLHDPSELIFTNSDGKLMSKYSCRSRFNTYLKEMDIFCNDRKKLHDPTRTARDDKMIIERFTPYDCRHTYATLLAGLDVPVRKTTALMGHATSATTDRYYIDWDSLDTAGSVVALEKKLKKLTT